MITKEFQDLRLSALGFGAMRLPTVGGNDTAIDEAAVLEMVDHAIRQGVNYFDTAWGYHGGQSEIVMGKALGRYPRDSYYLATKFPGYDLSNMNKVEAIFEKQLEKCGVDYFDFYLFHNVCEMNIDAYLDAQYGIFDYLKQQKDAGRIRHLGFSVHGSLDVTTRFLDAYGDHIEFGQIQLNYMDWSFQDAKAKVELLNKRGIPIWVMEPLRGGMLASLSDTHTAKLAALRPDETAPAWAFRFLQAVPGVTMVLTGASDLAQLRDNITTFAEDKLLNQQEFDMLLSNAADMLKSTALPCTACRYCISHCPQELDIPALLALYNEHCVTVGAGLMGFIAPMVLSTQPEDKRPGACVGCRNCEAVCPQTIKIADAMADFSVKLGQ